MRVYIHIYMFLYMCSSIYTYIHIYSFICVPYICIYSFGNLFLSAAVSSCSAALTFCSEAEEVLASSDRKMQTMSKGDGWFWCTQKRTDTASAYGGGYWGQCSGDHMSTALQAGWSAGSTLWSLSTPFTPGLAVLTWWGRALTQFSVYLLRASDQFQKDVNAKKSHFGKEERKKFRVTWWVGSVHVSTCSTCAGRLSKSLSLGTFTSLPLPGWPQWPPVWLHSLLLKMLWWEVLHFCISESHSFKGDC